MSWSQRTGWKNRQKSSPRGELYEPWASHQRIQLPGDTALPYLYRTQASSHTGHGRRWYRSQCCSNTACFCFSHSRLLIFNCCFSHLCYSNRKSHKKTLKSSSLYGGRGRGSPRFKKGGGGNSRSWGGKRLPRGKLRKLGGVRHLVFFGGVKSPSRTLL